ncbi:hypothetical protein ACYOEI_42715, partial [Singulisphaera rosea]
MTTTTASLTATEKAQILRKSPLLQVAKDLALELALEIIDANLDVEGAEGRVRDLTYRLERLLGDIYSMGMAEVVDEPESSSSDDDL